MKFPALFLRRGQHDYRRSGLCVMEACAMFAGEPHSDKPTCVSPVLRAFTITLNDKWEDDDRQRLVSFIPRLVGTAGDGQDEIRAFMALDWVVRTCTPTWLDLAGFTTEAADLRALRRIVDLDTELAGRSAIQAAQDNAANAAAYAAAYAAYAAAANAAAYAAAYAAGAAAANAAAYATATAATAAANAAASACRRLIGVGTDLRPIVEAMNASALELLDAMINPAAAAIPAQRLYVPQFVTA